MEPIMTHTTIGLIGGSGLYAMEYLTETREHHLETPFGATSDPVVTGRLDGVPVAFLARHGKGHRLIPSEVPYRANVLRAQDPWGALSHIGVCSRLLA
jgi:5'-methylthioadenosine phosphorylase